jgi:quercetin dioxygenase-like cupin family protein
MIKEIRDWELRIGDMEAFVEYREHVGVRKDKFYKTTLFEGEHVMAGLNCLEPGQEQAVHDHADNDKFYFVVEGRGTFTVGEEVREAGAGTLVAAPAGVPHGVVNTSDTRLVLLVAIAPPP